MEILLDILTEKTINLTRTWFAQNARKCSEDAISGVIKVNNLKDYLVSCKIKEEYALYGDINHFAFWQRAYFIQTGEFPSFLPKE
jgi:DNA-binding transcriptional regulator/RsmH inhibitor MraZ